MHIKEISALDLTNTLKQQNQPVPFKRPTEDDFYVKPVQWIEFLKKKGFKRMGTGSFAVTLSKPELPYIIKIPYKRDNSWYAFASYCTTHRNNPHLPKIQFLQKLTGSKFFVAAVEKLEMLHTKIRDTYALTSMLAHMEGGVQNPRSLKQIFDNCIEQALPPDRPWYETTLFPQLDGLSKTVQELSKSGRDMDLHDENVMLRGDTLVIQDPWYSWEDDYSNSKDRNEIDRAVYGVPKIKKQRA